MLGIFVVTAAIILAIVLMNRLTAKEEKHGRDGQQPQHPGAEIRLFHPMHLQEIFHQFQHSIRGGRRQWTDAAR